MRIAVIQHVRAGYYSDYLSILLDEIGAKNNYQVKTWSNSIPAFKQQISDNSIVYILAESAGAFALKWWYTRKLKSILNKLKPAVVIDLNGLSNKAKPSQVAVLDQVLLNKNTEALNVINNLALKKLKQTINHIKLAVTYSKYSAEKLSIQFSAGKKTRVIHFTAPDNFRKFEWHEKIMIKAMHADNNEYFISVLNDDAFDDFTLLLRGFSAFKKWQQSNMKLILLPKHEVFDERIHEKLKKYKHRDDVNLVESLDEIALVSIFASAHSLIHFSSGFTDLMILSIALKCAVPVISFKDDEVEEYLKAAAYYTTERSAEALSNALINLYKNEDLQLQLREAAEKQALLFNRENIRTELWQLLETAAHS